eukprot:4851256-Amphidinium_carterae.1
MQAIVAEARVPSVVMTNNAAAIWALSLASGMTTNDADSPQLKDRRWENPGLPRELDEAYFSELVTHYTLTNSGAQGTIRRKTTVLEALPQAKGAGFAVFHQDPLGAALDPSGCGMPTTAPMIGDPTLNAGGAYIVDLVTRWLSKRDGKDSATLLEALKMDVAG